jgi:phosphoglycerate dehydrogenase-like enzyme
MPKGLFVLDSASFESIYGPEERQAIEQLVEMVAPPHTAEMVAQNPSVLHEVEVIFSGWGCPVFTSDLLRHAPNLKALFYGAGSVKYLVTDAFWARGIQISSAYAANGIPVAEFTLSQIFFALKSGWQHVLNTRQKRTFERLPVAGGYGSTVGLVSLGMIGRMMVDRLKSYDLHLLAYDPFAAPLPGVTRCPLEEIFWRSDVVSIHTPWLKETEGLITGAHLRCMKPYSTLINTSRGAVIRENEMIAVLQERPDLTAVLDVTYPEPPAADSALYTLPNVILTPHIAGSIGAECRRMGQSMVNELRRYLAGEPLRYGLSKERVQIMA